MNFSAANLIGGLIFSGVGFVAFTYGKRQGHWRAMAVGAALMAYPYFVPDTLLLYVLGVVLTSALWWWKE